MVQSLFQGLAPAPFAYLLMVAASQYFRNRHSAKFRWTRVMRIIQQSARSARAVRPFDSGFLCCTKTFLPSRSFIPQRAGDEPGHCVYDHRSTQFTAAQHVIADGNLAVGQPFRYALIHAFIPAADQNHAFHPGQLLRHTLREQLSLRRK